MPRLNDDQEQHNVGHFGFSATKIENLEATEYTLVTIVADRSGSTSNFQNEMEMCLKEIVSSCIKSPRADNLLLRMIAFDDKQEEIHGFKLLSEIKPDDYNGCLNPGGLTSLYDSVVDGMEAMNIFGKKLLEQDYSCNGIIFVMTDGLNNRGVSTINQCKKCFVDAVSGENLESIVSVLIGVNANESSVKTGLESFAKDANFTNYCELKDANKNTLAKLAQFVSKSISSQSKSLGSGAAAQVQSVSF